MPAKKNSGVELAEELEMREGIGLMREVVSPCLEFGRGTGTRVAQPERMDLETKFSLLTPPSALTQGTGGIVEVNKDDLSGNPMFNNKVTKGSSDLFQGD